MCSKLTSFLKKNTAVVASRVSIWARLLGCSVLSTHLSSLKVSLRYLIREKMKTVTLRNFCLQWEQFCCMSHFLTRWRQSSDILTAARPVRSDLETWPMLLQSYDNLISSSCMSWEYRSHQISNLHTKDFQMLVQLKRKVSLLIQNFWHWCSAQPKKTSDWFKIIVITHIIESMISFLTFYATEVSL